VPGVGIEPTWDFSRGILSPLRLPFRHPGHNWNKVISGVEPNVCSLPPKVLKGPDRASAFPPMGGGAGTETALR
jgi:hypothetical protein